jgi:hypothetical protein
MTRPLSNQPYDLIHEVDALPQLARAMQPNELPGADAENEVRGTGEREGEKQVKSAVEKGC